jgi:hypothetical protein
MFFAPKDEKRKWQCFICGKEHTEYEEFKKHITENHEEGQEYIICPLARCGAPVRDIPLHMRVKHNGESVKNYHGPLRAIIWKDQRGPKGKKKTRKPTFREGHFISLKNSGKEFFYRSSYECTVLECLELIPEVIAYDVEPIKGGIPYLFEGEQHLYHPDISIKFADGHIEIWEIKPSNQTTLPKNLAKWVSAENFCKARDWQFVVITEQGINKLKKKTRVSR